MNEEIQTALDSLDHGDDAHWTKSGLPDLNAIKEKCGFAVKRGELPKDFVRNMDDIEADVEEEMTLPQKVSVMIVALQAHKPLPADLDSALRSMKKWRSK